MIRIPRLLAPALLPLLLSACSVIGGPRETPTVYAPEPDTRPDPGWPSVPWTLATSRPGAARMLDGGRIVVSPVPGELQVYKGATWARPPSEMLEDAVLRTLEDSGKLPAVSRQGNGIRADYRLVMDIRHFEARYDEDGHAGPSAVIEVNAKLVRLQDQSVAGSRTFRQVRAASGVEVARVADAFALALGALGRDIAGWTLQTGPAARPL